MLDKQKSVHCITSNIPERPHTLRRCCKWLLLSRNTQWTAGSVQIVAFWRHRHFSSQRHPVLYRWNLTVRKPSYWQLSSRTPGRAVFIRANDVLLFVTKYSGQWSTLNDFSYQPLLYLSKCQCFIFSTVHFWVQRSAVTGFLLFCLWILHTTVVFTLQVSGQ